MHRSKTIRYPYSMHVLPIARKCRRRCKGHTPIRKNKEQMQIVTSIMLRFPTDLHTRFVMDSLANGAECSKIQKLSSACPDCKYVLDLCGNNMRNNKRCDMHRSMAFLGCNYIP